MSLRILTALPVFNEERHVIDVIAEVRKYSKEILVVDDGSSDKTPEILKSLRDVYVVRHQQNQGYGAALRTAFPPSSASTCIFLSFRTAVLARRF